MCIWDKHSVDHRALRALVFDAFWSLHLTKPGTYMTLKPTSLLNFPLMARLKSEPNFDCCVIELGGGVSLGEDNGGIDKCHFVVLPGDPKIPWVPGNEVTVDIDDIEFIGGAPCNDLGGRRALTQYNSYICKHEDYKALNIYNYSDVCRWLDSNDRQATYEKVFDQAEVKLRKAAKKISGGPAQTAYIEEYMPLIELCRDSFDTNVKIFNIPIVQRIVTLPVDAPQFVTDADVLEDVLDGLREELACVPPPLPSRFHSTALPPA
jgi:hypothetical protein